ncbi:MAG: hypothetical protein P8J64_01030 [Dehalococcoidia bacterium]|nr:hypothetical protein [Dehalococcoidia bacterium]
MASSDRNKRDSKLMKDELKRVLQVGIVSFGMLLALFIVDRV